jgi:hypothetical protein
MVKDWGYMAAFDSKDLPALQEMAKQIRETHNTDMIEDINNSFDQNASHLPNGIAIRSIAKTDDLIVNVGIEQCINIILNTSSARWSHMALSVSAGAATPSVSDTALGGTAVFVPMATYGWIEPRGMKLFFGAIGDTDAGNAGLIGASTVHEMGVYNGGTSAFTLLNRENFFNNRPIRTATADVQQYSSVFIFSSVIEFCPVA